MKQSYALFIGLLSFICISGTSLAAASAGPAQGSFSLAKAFKTGQLAGEKTAGASQGDMARIRACADALLVRVSVFEIKKTQGDSFIESIRTESPEIFERLIEKRSEAESSNQQDTFYNNILVLQNAYQRGISFLAHFLKAERAEQLWFDLIDKTLGTGDVYPSLSLQEYIDQIFHDFKKLAQCLTYTSHTVEPQTCAWVVNKAKKRSLAVENTMPDPEEYTFETNAILWFLRYCSEKTKTSVNRALLDSFVQRGDQKISSLLIEKFRNYIYAYKGKSGSLWRIDMSFRSLALAGHAPLK